MNDSFSTNDSLEVNGKKYRYASLARLGKQFKLEKLPYSMKILLENLLRQVALRVGHMRAELLR